MTRYRERPLAEEGRRRREESRRAREGMLSRASALLAAARELHNREERLYGEAMSWERAEELTETVLCWME